MPRAPFGLVFRPFSVLAWVGASQVREAADISPEADAFVSAARRSLLISPRHHGTSRFSKWIRTQYNALLAPHKCLPRARGNDKWHWSKR